MPDKFITLLEITKRRGGDLEVGLVDEITTFAPELNVLRGKTVNGTSYHTKKRVAVPSASFRRANEGSDLVASSYDRILQECFILDGQMQMDQMVANADEAGPASVLTDETQGIIRGTGIALGSRVFYGVGSETDYGFDGLQSLVDSTMVIDALGASANAVTSVYLIRNDIQGVHMIWGRNGGLVTSGDWRIQQVKDANNKALMAYVNSYGGWIGMAVEFSKSILRIKNIDATHPLTDQLLAKAWAKFPIGMKPNMLFCNQDANLGLQLSRSAISQVAFKLGAAEATPNSSPSTPGITWVVTDSLVSTEPVA